MFRFKVVKPGFQKPNVVNLRLASLWKSDLNLLNISIFYLCSQCSRSKFNFLFQLSSYANKKVFLNIFLAINMASQDFYCKFHVLGGFLFFFCHSKMPKTLKMLMKKYVYWWINHGNLKVILFFL